MRKNGKRKKKRNTKSKSAALHKLLIPIIMATQHKTIPSLCSKLLLVCSWIVCLIILESCWTKNENSPQGQASLSEDDARDEKKETPEEKKAKEIEILLQQAKSYKKLLADKKSALLIHKKSKKTIDDGNEEAVKNKWQLEEKDLEEWKRQSEALGKEITDTSKCIQETQKELRRLAKELLGKGVEKSRVVTATGLTVEEVDALCNE